MPLQVVTDSSGKEFLVKNASTTQKVEANTVSLETKEEDKTPMATVTTPTGTGDTGTGEGHKHDIDADDLRPAFTQFLFIIRVK